MKPRSFGGWLRQQLARREMTQADFAKEMHASTGTVSDWVNEKRLPSSESCDRIADILHEDVDLVLTLAGHRPVSVPLAVDDPLRELHALLDRVELNPDKVTAIRSLLTGFLERQRHHNEASPSPGRTDGRVETGG